MTPETYARACELDDNLPLSVCPGCGQNLTGMQCGDNHMTPKQWERHQIRYRSANGNWHSRVAESPFVAANHAGPRCVWTSDFLVARSMRRRWRLAYETEHGITREAS